MKKTVVLFSFLFTMSILVFAQTPVKFRKVLGNVGYDNGYYAEQTTDKGYIVAATTSSVASSTEMYAIKTDSMGVIQYSSSFGGINIEKALSVKQTFDKGYILMGFTNSFGNGGYDIYMVKLDSTFTFQWEKTYGGTDWDFGTCVVQTADTGYAICGSTYSYGAGNMDYYMIKTNASGDTLWTKTFGGVADDEANCIKQTVDGGYVLTGYTKSMGDSLGDFYTLRLNSLGDTLWTNKYGAISKKDIAYGVLESSTGEIIVSGETETVGAGGSDGIAIRLLSTGTYDNNFTFGGGSFDGFKSVSEDALGRFSMCGGTTSFGLNGDMLFCVIDHNLGFFNATTFGTNYNDDGSSAEPTADKGFILCGSTKGFNNNLGDIYLIKTDTFGLSGLSSSETFVWIGIEEQFYSKNDLFRIYPNPAAETVKVEMDNYTYDGESTIIVYDIVGKEVLRENAFAGYSGSIDVSGLPNGMYSLSIVNKDFISSQKLIIHH